MPLAVSIPCFAGEFCEGGASWFVDPVRYHISAHGQISCQDCHQDVIHRPTHPDPAQANRDSSDFFKVETCFECHGGVKSNFEKGLHAGKQLRSEKDYTKCIACHSPHYEPRHVKKVILEPTTKTQTREICAKCHEHKQALPEPSGENAKCLNCHKAYQPHNKERVEHISRFCLGCHGHDMPFTASPVTIPLIDKDKHIIKGHDGLDCMSCHSHAARFQHGRQGSPNCRTCHTHHRESIIHDAHSVVSCQACHLEKIKVLRDPNTREVLWEKPQRTSQPSWLNVVRPSPGTGSCERCHHAENPIGAAAMVLPAKSLICMPCHAATFSANDLTSALALVGFALGICAVASVWFSGTVRSRTGPVARIYRPVKEDFVGRAIDFVKALFLDGLLQRKLFIQSRLRWSIHALILWPFVVRFSWGVVALIGSLAWPTHDWVWDMLDKNWFLTAFVFDLTGLMVIFGIILAILRRRISSDEGLIEGLPERDWLAFGLLGAIVIVGFFLEGARMAMSPPAKSGNLAFVGLGLSLLWQRTSGLTEIYGYLWYLHAVLTGAFLVYLPFSGLFHVVMAPLVAAVNAAEHFHTHRNGPGHVKTRGSEHG